MMKERTLSVSCHCGLSTYTFNIPTSFLPIRQTLCHCDISRQISGCLCTSYVEVPVSNPAPNLATLTAYKSSDMLTRHFCTTCSTHMYLEYNHDGHFEVSHGSILGKTDDILDFVGHMWIDDTRDGGASIWMSTFGSREAEKWPTETHYSGVSSDRSQDSEKAPATSLKSTFILPPNPSSDRSKRDKLHAHCHCGGVSFFVARPDKEASVATSSFPDLLVPYNSGASAENPENEAWWIAKDGYRWLAGNCSCDSCRRIAGFDVVQWAFIPLTSLFLDDGKPLTRTFDDKFETLTSYCSSEGRTRWFCKRCGANAFWEGDERPSLIDVAVGLFDAESGTRAEEWLEWVKERVSFREDGHNGELICSLENGLSRCEKGN